MAGEKNVIQANLGGKGVVISIDNSMLIVENNFVSSSRAIDSLDPVAYCSIALAGKGYSPHVLDEIFSQGRATLYKTTKGYFQRFRGTGDERHPMWDLEINAQFSRFEYFLYLENIEKFGTLDPWGLASALFLLQHSFINHQGLIIHAAGGSVYGKGLVFPAPSGTGKSTLSRLLLADLHNRLFSEERLIVRSVHDVWQVWGTPWHGEGMIARNEAVPLSALIFLRQARKTKITELSPATGLHRLLQTVSIPWYSDEWVNKGLGVCELLLQEIPAFELAFRPDQSAVQAVENLALSLA